MSHEELGATRLWVHHHLILLSPLFSNHVFRMGFLTIFTSSPNKHLLSAYYVRFCILIMQWWERGPLTHKSQIGGRQICKQADTMEWDKHHARALWGADDSSYPSPENQQMTPQSFSSFFFSSSFSLSLPLPSPPFPSLSLSLSIFLFLTFPEFLLSARHHPRWYEVFALDSYNSTHWILDKFQNK